jgi:hypothetical protein
MSDPKLEGRGIRMAIAGPKGAPDSPSFKRAQVACKSFNPKKPKGGPAPSGKG